MVERFKAIQAFVPETFYKIKGAARAPPEMPGSPDSSLTVSLSLFLSFSVLHEVEEDAVEFSWKRNRLFNHTACLVLYQICMEVSGESVRQDASVSDVRLNGEERGKQ